MIIHLDRPGLYTGTPTIWWISRQTRLRRYVSFLFWDIPLPRCFDTLGERLKVGDYLNGGRIVEINH